VDFLKHRNPCHSCKGRKSGGKKKGSWPGGTGKRTVKEGPGEEKTSERHTLCTSASARAMEKRIEGIECDYMSNQYMVHAGGSTDPEKSKPRE